MDALAYEYQTPSVGKYGEESWERVTYNDYWAAKHKVLVYLVASSTAV
jgi:hypothetical protein